MGSSSDLPVMQAAAEACREFGVAVELDVVSAHRTPQKMMDYARTARELGLPVVMVARPSAPSGAAIVATVPEPRAAAVHALRWARGNVSPQPDADGAG